MSDTPERDPLDEFLAPADPVDTAALRQSLLAATTRRLRRPRWARRAALAAALAACYAAGLLTMRVLAPAAPGPHPVEATVKDDVPPVVITAEAVERRAETAADAERAALLRQAGDRYLDEETDPASALRCYSKSLDAGSQDDAKFSPDDNWLMMAIKNAREKEARDAN